MAPTRYTLEMNFLGGSENAWEDWQQFAIEPIAYQTMIGYTSGEISLYDDDISYRVYWELKEVKEIDA